MAPLRPGLIGVLLLVLAALLGQGTGPLVKAPGLSGHAAEIADSGEIPRAILAASVQSWDDPDDDLSGAVGRRSATAARLGTWRADPLHPGALLRRAMPRSTGPPAVPLPA